MINAMEDCERLASSIVVSLVAGIMGVLLGIFIIEIPLKFRKWFGYDKSKFSSFQKDLMDIKKTTFQIAQDWIEMTKLITVIQEHQTSFVERLQSEFQDKSEALRHNINVSLEEEFSRNNNLFVKVMQTIEIMQGDILSIKQCLQTFSPKSDDLSNTNSNSEKKGRHAPLVNNSSQTESEMKRRVRDGHTKSGTIPQPEVSKLISLVKKCLTDLMKDAKLHLSIDSEDENRELQIIFSKLAEDREDIKKTIVQAFSIAADQAKKNFDQFGHIGQEAMHYIAVLNEKTHNMMKTKLEEADDRLKEILNNVERQNFDVVTIRETLENIDGQFDEIFQRVELGCQRNAKHCEEMAESLEKTSNNWVGTAVELERMAKEFSNDTKNMKEILKEMKNLVNSVQQRDINNIQDSSKSKNEIIQFESIASTTTQDLRLHSQKQSNTIFIYSMMQSCWDKMSCMNGKVENGCEEICKLIETLRQKLLSLNESVEKLDEDLRNISMENLGSPIFCTKCHDENFEEILETMVRSNMGQAGDGQSTVFQEINSKLTNETLAQKIQNAIAIDKEVKMIDLILKKVCEKRNLYQKEKVSIQSMNDTVNITDESQGTVTVTNEHKSNGITELEQDDAQTSRQAEEIKSRNMLITDC